MIEGIGRRFVSASFVPASFVPSLVDCMLPVPDAASLAAMRWLAKRLGRRFGPSTGANMLGVLLLATELRARGQVGSIVTLACDSGERCAQTSYDAEWLAQQRVDLAPWAAALDAFELTRKLVPPTPLAPVRR